MESILYQTKYILLIHFKTNLIEITIILIKRIRRQAKRVKNFYSKNNKLSMNIMNPTIKECMKENIAFVFMINKYFSKYVECV